MSKSANSTLSRLVEKCQVGDSKAWYQLIDIISPLVFSICHKMRVSRDESFDVFGQVCYALLKNIRKLKSSDKVLSYVSTMTKREVYALMRKSRFTANLDQESINAVSDSQEKIPDRLFELTKQNEMLMKALISLPEREQRLIRTLFFEHSKPNYALISNNLEIPVSSIGPTRARSLVKLYKILKRKGYDFDY